MHRDELIERAVRAFRADDRIMAVWLGGSLGRGRGDEFSDVDFVIAVEVAGQAGFVEHWDDLVADIVPVVLRQRLDGGGIVVFTHVTDGWLRFDATIVTSAPSPDGLMPLFDRGLLDDSPAAVAEPSRAAALTTEFLRVLGLLPVVLGREEYVVGASGAGLLRGLLIQLMLDGVPERGGALRLRGILSDDQLATLTALPPIAANRESVLAVHLACARAFLPLARSRVGSDQWPADLERALRDHLRRTLGVDDESGLRG